MGCSSKSDDTSSKITVYIPGFGYYRVMGEIKRLGDGTISFRGTQQNSKEIKKRNG